MKKDKQAWYNHQVTVSIDSLCPKCQSIVRAHMDKRNSKDENEVTLCRKCLKKLKTTLDELNRK